MNICFVNRCSPETRQDVVNRLQIDMNKSAFAIVIPRWISQIDVVLLFHANCFCTLKKFWKYFKDIVGQCKIFGIKTCLITTSLKYWNPKIFCRIWKAKYFGFLHGCKGSMKRKKQICCWMYLHASRCIYISCICNVYMLVLKYKI